ncbi:MAG TPA: radical SAM protein, partial [Myxococcales bacterium]|nr:radical SAM protein [Myxococcales bacterium]
MLKLLFADESGQVYEHPELLAVARDGFPLEQPEPLPVHATLAALPGRRPLGFDPASGRVVELSSMRLGRRTLRPSAVAAVLPPGWTRSELPAFRKTAIAPVLPQWAYTAA